MAGLIDCLYDFRKLQCDCAVQAPAGFAGFQDLVYRRGRMPDMVDAGQCGEGHTSEDLQELVRPQVLQKTQLPLTR